MNGLFMVGLPESTVEVINMISQKTGLSFVDVISESLKNFAANTLVEKQDEQKQEKPKPKIGFRR